MRNDVISELFYGNINPSDKQFRRDSEFGRTAAAVGEAEERLCELLNDEGKSVLKKLMSGQMTLDGITAQENFIDGFRLGARIAFAIMDDSSENLLPITD